MARSALQRNALRRGVEHHDALLRVDRDDGFRGGLDDVEKRWRVGHRLHGRRSGCAGAGPARVKDCSTSARAAPQARCIAPNGRLARVPVFVRADGLSGAAALSRPPARPDPPSRWPGRPSGSALEAAQGRVAFAGQHIVLRAAGWNGAGAGHGGDIVHRAKSAIARHHADDRVGGHQRPLGVQEGPHGRGQRAQPHRRDQDDVVVGVQGRPGMRKAGLRWNTLSTMQRRSPYSPILGAASRTSCTGQRVSSARRSRPRRRCRCGKRCRCGS